MLDVDFCSTHCTHASPLQRDDDLVDDRGIVSCRCSPDQIWGQPDQYAAEKGVSLVRTAGCAPRASRPCSASPWQSIANRPTAPARTAADRAPDWSRKRPACCG